jgi:uncharacterized SAM-binding protein YcdF (DUF218 family)
MVASAAVTRTRPPLRLVVLAAAMALLVAVLFWGAGFAWFLRIATRPPVTPPVADGIVVLTGGAERVETGLRLLADGRGRKLLVSGVNRAAAFDQLARLAGVDPSLSARVTLGRAAEDTHGNALEAAGWVHDNRISTLIVVTAGYHMPRALAELSRTVPQVTLYPYPVLSPILRSNPDAASLKLLAGEYTKWLVSEVGLSGLAARTDDGEPAVHGTERGS